MFRNIRVWRLKDGALTCLLVGSGHTEAVGGLTFSRQLSALLVSVSKDTTIKTWSLDFAGATMASTRTEIGHDKGGIGILSVLWTGLRIRIHFIRIRIQHFRLNTDTDPDPIRIQGFNDQKFKKIPAEKKIKFFFIKNYNLPIPRPP